jgi:hypothetical protein
MVEYVKNSPDEQKKDSYQNAADRPARQPETLPALIPWLEILVQPLSQTHRDSWMYEEPSQPISQCRRPSRA